MKSQKVKAEPGPTPTGSISVGHRAGCSRPSWVLQPFTHFHLPSLYSSLFSEFPTFFRENSPTLGIPLVSLNWESANYIKPNPASLGKYSGNAATLSLLCTVYSCCSGRVTQFADGPSKPVTEIFPLLVIKGEDVVLSWLLRSKGEVSLAIRKIEKRIILFLDIVLCGVVWDYYNHHMANLRMKSALLERKNS